MPIGRPTVAAAIALLALTLSPALGAEHSHFSDPYSIMAPERSPQPEPWLAPKYKSPRGLPQRPRAVRPRRIAPQRGVAVAPPPVILPNGRAIPSLPPVNHGIVPGGGTETFSDRVSRCVHQGALNGVPAGQQSVYINTCAMGQ